jgi:hypothetical protein
MALAGAAGSLSDLPVRVGTWALVAASLLGLTFLVLNRRGNLGWDDADYLRRGLSCARLAAGDGGFSLIPRTMSILVQEQPKPPFLVGWIMLGASMFGRSSLDFLLIQGSVLPFAILVLATVAMGRRSQGSWAGLLAVVLLVSSPRGLSFGGKVMVETSLALWVLLALALAAELPARPTRRLGVALGLATGLALLTKVTTVLLLAGPIVPFGWWVARRGSDRTARLRALVWAIATCLVVAGPWYVWNAPAALRFALSSAQFNLVAEGHSRVIPTADRLFHLVADLPGWPLAVILGIASIGRALGREPGDCRDLAVGLVSRLQTSSSRFGLLVGTSTLAATCLLLIPPYFDSRFLLPLWPSLALALGCSLAAWLHGLGQWPRLALCAGLMVSLAASAAGLAREPVSATYWSVGRLLDRLVARHGATNLANVGNIESWNVCKTGLINELRRNPGDCFVLHDLSAESVEGLRGRLPRFDAVAVLEPSAFPRGFLSARPGLNRARSFIDAVVRADPELVRAEDLPLEGLPPLAIYVRDRGGKIREGRYAAHLAGSNSHDAP